MSRYTICHLRDTGTGPVVRSPWPGTKSAEEAAYVVREATMQQAHDSIARLDSLVPAVVIPYMDDPSQGVEVRLAEESA